VVECSYTPTVERTCGYVQLLISLFCFSMCLAWS
jgi:hypothetical protein